MFDNAQPLFPQGLVGTYKHKDYVLDPALIENLQRSQEINGIRTTQLKAMRNENILDQEVLFPIRDFIVDSIHHYLHNVAAIPYEEFWFTSSWINWTDSGGNQAYHNHTNSIVSGCYYIYCTEDMPGLTFRKEHRSHKPYISVFQNTEANPIHCDHAELKTNTGDLVIFPSHMIHGYDNNKSNETRITLAWNILLNQPEELAPQGWYHIRFAK